MMQNCRNVDLSVDSGVDRELRLRKGYEFTGDNAIRIDNESAIHYNFMERKDNSSNYNSLQKT